MQSSLTEDPVGPATKGATRGRGSHERGEGRVRHREVLVALRRIMRSVELHSHELQQRYGLTGPQLIVLQEVSRREETNLGELARAMSVSQATMTGIVRRLEESGFLERRRSERDRRHVLVKVSPAGRAVLSSGPRPLHDSFVHQFNSLPEREQRKILDALQRVVGMMEADRLDISPILASGPLAATREETVEARTPRRRKSS